MKAPNRFIELIEDRKLKEVVDWITDISDEMMDIGQIEIVEEPRGDYQDDDEYCDQYELSSEAGVYAYNGIYYHKIEDSDWWLSYEYYMSA